jgi:aminoglycoside phosphotransferase (APT) family kinase protein
VLRALAGSAVPVPVVVALDPDGGASGEPALLTERLPGLPPTIGLISQPRTLRILGEALAEVHRAGARVADDATLRRLVPDYYPFGDLANATIPAESSRPDVWRAALEIASEPAPETPTTLIHRDYHAWNTLWADGRLTGVVDWSSASWGPPAADLAHLRVDLAVDVSVEAAIAARAAFREAGGDLTNARHHQLRTVFDYLTDWEPSRLPPGAVGRLDRFLAVVLDE